MLIEILYTVHRSLIYWKKNSFDCFYLTVDALPRDVLKTNQLSFHEDPLWESWDSCCVNCDWLVVGWFQRMQLVGNKAKARISKRMFQENKARQIFRKTNISYSLIHTRTFYQIMLLFGFFVKNYPIHSSLRNSCTSRVFGGRGPNFLKKARMY